MAYSRAIRRKLCMSACVRPAHAASASGMRCPGGAPVEPALASTKRHRMHPRLGTAAAVGPVQARTTTSRRCPPIMPTWPVSRQWAVELRAAASAPPAPHRAPPARAAGRARLLADVLLRDEVGEGDALAGAEGHSAVVGDVGAVEGKHDVAALQHLARGRGWLHAPHVHALLPGLLARRRRSAGQLSATAAKRSHGTDAAAYVISQGGVA